MFQSPELPIGFDLSVWNVCLCQLQDTSIFHLLDCLYEELEPYIIVAVQLFLLLLEQSDKWANGIPDILNRLNISHPGMSVHLPGMSSVDDIWIVFMMPVPCLDHSLIVMG